MEIYLASQNQNKIEEIRACLPPKFKLITLSKEDIGHEIEETGTTLEENACIKAEFVYKLKGGLVFSDDTGLEVDALNNAPGVYSARYSGLAHDSEANMNLLLVNLESQINRKAQFRTVFCLYNGKDKFFFQGILAGQISHSKKGTNGFGYDPIFIPDGFTKTLAELSADKKNEISHRAMALKEMTAYLNSL
jgi:XTP/dITP diphosphohydrolase